MGDGAFSSFMRSAEAVPPAVDVMPIFLAAFARRAPLSLTHGDSLFADRALLGPQPLLPTPSRRRLLRVSHLSPVSVSVALALGGRRGERF